jgi:hypothetical protein
MKAESRQRCIVVLGAGRSGTSAITCGVQALGVELGSDLRPGGGKNPTGFFEDQALLALNKRLKRALGIRGDSVRLLESADWSRPEVRALKGEAIKTIHDRFGTYPVWGYKYGRTLRLLPFWEEVYDALSLDVRYVIATRNPLSVALSRRKLEARRGTQEKSDLEWLVNVVPYLRRACQRAFVVVDYDLLMSDPVRQLARIAERFDLPVTAEVKVSIEAYVREFLRPDMRHSRFAESDLERAGEVNELVRHAYRWLHCLATDEVHSDSTDLWEDWERIEKGLAAMAPVLRHIDRLENELRRAQSSLLGPLQAAPRLWRKLRGK